ncbi:protein regulator of cytokinesis 1-like [Eupeodes corollae]|uniref:protein regulator of cytokinesis 1-like n=1 Tax=Eupeodes corollae TaxID=290404 RepID=UPI0024905CD9|nr:protein regulator of cytokinesis 1-like [Eupeodes corollae]
MSDLFNQAQKDMQILTQTYVHELTQIWKKIFDENACKENIAKLEEHTKNYFEDLVLESMEKQEQIEKEILDLRSEAENLQRLLKVDINLKPSEDVPLLVLQSELDESLTELRETLRLRREQIFELLLEQDTLCSELGEEPRSLVADPLPSEEELQEFRQHLEVLKEEKVDRLNRVSTMRREIKNYLQILEVKMFSENDDRLLNHRQIKLSKETFDGLKEMHARYRDQVLELEDTIHGMKRKLNSLWDRLDTSPATRNKFSRYTDYSQSTADILHKEVNRCELLKKQNIKLFVEQIRKEILEWWDKCMKSDVQRSRFSNFYSDCFTDDLLILHEMELEDLKTFYQQNEKIFQLFEDRRILWERMTALEQKASEPGRYNNRGGQLLKEEKERKTIASKLPKIEALLTELVQAYEEKEHKNFLIYGENILDLISRDWEKKKMEKEKLSSARKNPQTPVATRTPMSIRNCQMSASSIMKRTPSTTNISSAVSSNKRKLGPTDRQAPSAKRSLLNVLSSPSVFGYSTSNNTKTPFKSPFKKNRVLATTIRRRSARQSGSAKKRRSSSRQQPKGAPKITVTESSDLSDADNYEHFQKCIEPAARSSIMPTSSASGSSSSRLRKPATSKENIRLPNPRLARVPSKMNLMDTMSKSPAMMHHTSHSPSTTSSSSRKLTTKNLPILI